MLDIFINRPLVYLDNAATTKPDPRVIDYVKDFMITYYFNPSSSYEYGEYVRNEIEKSRQIIADFVGCKRNEIIFTSGGSESDNMCLKGILKQGDHVITSSIEHKAILNTCKHLEKQGVEVTYLHTYSSGKIDIDELKNAIQPNTKLISIMAINNEIGTKQDLLEIGKVAKEYGIKFHTDAVQAFGKSVIDIDKYNIDYMSVSSHKINGLKGTGFLYAKNQEISQLIDGGEQEFYLRGGTENVIGILALGKAVEIINSEFNERVNYVNYLCAKFIELLKEDNFVSYSKSLSKGFFTNNSESHIINICFPNLRGEVITRLLDTNGICASTGSACNTHSGEPSHVLKAIGLTDDEADSSVRFSLSHTNTLEEIEYTVKTLKNIVSQLGQ